MFLCLSAAGPVLGVACNFCTLTPYVEDQSIPETELEPILKNERIHSGEECNGQ